MTEEQKSLTGENPSFYNKNTNLYTYVTNHGTIEIDGTTRWVKRCCIGFSNTSIPHANKYITIRILDNEFSIRTGTISHENTELSSKNYPYKLLHSEAPIMDEVFDTLSHIGVQAMSRSVLAVLMKLIHLMEINGKVAGNYYELEGLRGRLMEYSENILRYPVVTRKPILSSKKHK